MTLDEAIDLTFDGRRVLLLSPEDYAVVFNSLKDTSRFCFDNWQAAGIEHIRLGPRLGVPVARIDPVQTRRATDE